MKLTTEQFIEKARAVHGVRYDYTNAKYVKAKAKVTIICPIHGEFEQTPDSHTRGSGCPYCAHNLTSSTSKFIDKAISVHGDKYLYDNTNYIKAHGKVTITCPEHGIFSITPLNHLQGHGCPVCSGNKHNTTSFIAKATIVHDDRYDYSKVVYIHNRANVTITCKEHGDFTQLPANHLLGHGCPSCAVTGFNPNKPAILYYLKINGGQCYKIGITNLTIDERFTNSELQLIEIVKTWYYENGADAYMEEQKILKDYKQHKYEGRALLRSGNTELFNTDILRINDETN